MECRLVTVNQRPPPKKISLDEIRRVGGSFVQRAARNPAIASLMSAARGAPSTAFGHKLLALEESHLFQATYV
jgi:hypothetical protein